MKKMLAWILSLSLIFSLIPAVGATEGSEDMDVFAIGEAEYVFTEDASGDGWSYDAGTMALTLDNISGGVIDLGNAPEGVHIVLADGSENELYSLNLPWNGYEDGYFIPVSGDGTLRCLSHSVYGSVQVDSGTVFIDWMSGALRIDGGDVTVEKIKAAPFVEVNGGSLTIDSLDTYAYTQRGGTVCAATMTNCNGTSLNKMYYEISGGSFILDDSGEEDKSDLGAFLCLVWDARLSEYKWVFESFVSNLVGADGEAIEVKYIGYDPETGEQIEDPDRRFEGSISAILCNRDGTPAHYVQYSPKFTVAEEEYSFVEDASGDGWSYDADTMTLTLDGVSMGGIYEDSVDPSGIDLENAPAGLQVVCAADSVNQLYSLTLPDGEGTSITGEGKLRILSSLGGPIAVGGSVTIENEGSFYGSLTVNGGVIEGGRVYGGDVLVNDGDVTLESTKAANSVIVNGGTLTITELDTYTFELYGGTVKAVRMSNCNGTSPSGMKYVLAGGTLILDNTAGEMLYDSVFQCAAYGTRVSTLQEIVGVFEETMVDENGQPLTLKYQYYDSESDGMVETTDGSYFGVFGAYLYDSDGTYADYAEFRFDGPCESHNIFYYRYNDRCHWLACPHCGVDIPGEEEEHSYTSFGQVQYCLCGYSYTAEEEVPVDEGSMELGLLIWLDRKPVNSFEMFETLDRDGDETLTVRDMALLHMETQGVEAPEEFIPVCMSYDANGKGLGTLNAAADLSDRWDTIKLFVLDPETFAPLVDLTGTGRWEPLELF